MVRDTPAVSEAPRRGRGRPRGRTSKGADTRARLYSVATRLIAERGFEATTLRLIAREAGVSPGLLYRYFPNKSALVLELYQQTSGEFAAQAAELPQGKWVPRVLAALRASLEVLAPHRRTLRALVPLLVGDPEQGLFGAQTVTARERVQGVFEAAVLGASNAPQGDLGPALARVLYVLHLGVILWWLLDKSPKQQATRGLLALIEASAGALALALRLSPTRRAVITLDGLVRSGLFGEGQDLPAPA